MSYGVRNSLILLVVLVIFLSGGWGYINFYQVPQIEELESRIETQAAELKQKQQVANQYETVLGQFENAQFYLENFDKALYPTHNEDEVFDFLNTLNRGSSFTNFTFTFSDSVARGQYGTISMGISGSGYYRYLVNFIRKVEFSKPLNKIRNLNINPINNLDDYGKVDYNFSLVSYYDRERILDSTPSFEVADVAYSSLYNPFYPLVRDIQPNEENLTNIEQSRVLAISSEKIFVLDQNGVMQQIKIGDNVYLGTLEDINLEKREATFKLNKGGIIELVTLEVNND